MVVSIIDKSVNYNETKQLETKDISKRRYLYELQLGNEKLIKKNVVISLGKIQSLDGKEIYYFPIYLITKEKKGIKIGVYEILSQDKSLIYNEETNEVENTNLLNSPLLFSWVDNEFIQKNALSPSIIEEEERKEKVVEEEKEEEQEEVVEENIPDYRADIFEKQSVPIPSLLIEETKENADRHRKKNDLNEISQFMENENYNIINIPDIKNSDSLLTSVIQAFNTIGETTNEKKLKKKLSESKYIKKYLTSQKEKYNEQVDILKEITSEKTRLTERHHKIKEEYPIISKDKSKKEQAIQLKQENSNILKIIKDLKEQEKKLKELIKSLEYLNKIDVELTSLSSAKNSELTNDTRQRVVLLGDIFLLINDVEKAKKYFLYGQKINKKLPFLKQWGIPYVFEGNLYIKLKKFDGAIKSFNDGIKLQLYNGRYKGVME